MYRKVFIPIALVIGIFFLYQALQGLQQASNSDLPEIAANLTGLSVEYLVLGLTLLCGVLVELKKHNNVTISLLNLALVAVLSYISFAINFLLVTDSNTYVTVSYVIGAIAISAEAIIAGWTFKKQ